MKKLLLGGNMPYSVLIALVLAAYLFGGKMSQVTSSGLAKPACGIAVADKGEVILEALLANPEMSKDQRKTNIVTPILDVMRKYQTQGFAVIDMSRNDAGEMTVAAVPANAIDITNELRHAVHLPPSTPSVPHQINAKPASAPDVPKAASGAGND
ncbi:MULTISPECIES: hypothetical protein [Paraburkholderia]|uniref:Uncharacterized protein n=1 Tax=Paraburkholderia madseniana TaxID=2599607 RepID=A0AAP5BLZ8_9BURK|nr:MULTISPECIES: hypothetical protein [Paraburkholderia]MCX4151031.1 hypothetical protein [Paraburkholderia madseniana]MCX4176671.1 hypothetical protein [Paraburkholderia madseniana]MDN7153963.1 hypothetical protein [Paraburkholderia sp. WS6]MDQ6412845.1 hypothetical protein [Paraburkholderia madseniana]MDQ6464662.1 hypothetical protein [Paraburkholderia madseniana]